MKKTISLRYAIILVLFFAIAASSITAVVYHYAVIPQREGAAGRYLDKLLEIKQLVDRYYVGDTDDAVLADSVAEGFLWGLNDKYSDYVPASDAEASMNASFYGLNTGLGIQVTAHPDNGTIYVLEVHEGSPAAAAGIQPGDEMIQLDTFTVAEYGYSESLAYIKSLADGATLHAVINREGETVETDILLTQYGSQSVFYKMIEDAGYIQITEFNDRSVEQFENAVDDVIENGAKFIVFDLRGNGGGTLMSVYHMIDYLIPEGLAVRVEYKDEGDEEEYLSDAHEINLPMAVLTDQNTASASELFSQALKDYGKAISVGRLTYGKGVVQRTFSLRDGSLVRFTIGKYYTANGKCLDGIGVIPDIEITWTEEEMKYRLINGIENDKDYIAACEYLRQNQLS